VIIPRILLDALDWCRRWREVLLGGGGRGWSSTGWWNGGLQTRSHAKNRNRSIEMARTCQDSPSFLRTPPATGHFTVARILLLHARAFTEWRWQSRKIIIGNGQCGRHHTSFQHHHNLPRSSCASKSRRTSALFYWMAIMHAIFRTRHANSI